MNLYAARALFGSIILGMGIGKTVRGIDDPFEAVVATLCLAVGFLLCRDELARLRDDPWW